MQAAQCLEQQQRRWQGRWRLDSYQQRQPLDESQIHENYKSDSNTASGHDDHRAEDVPDVAAKNLHAHRPARRVRGHRSFNVGRELTDHATRRL